MAVNINNVQVAGNVTRDVHIRFLANEKAVADFGIAINRKYRNAGGEIVEDVTFVDVEVWAKQAELCAKYLSKGSNCMIEGSLKLERWEDKNTGGKRSKIKVSAHRVHFIGGSHDSKSSAQDQPRTTQERVDDEPAF